MNLWQSVKCRVGLHKISVITYRVGYASDHIGCEACERQWGINHDVRAVLPWSDVRILYADMHGYDEAAAVKKWRNALSPTPHQSGGGR